MAAPEIFIGEPVPLPEHTATIIPFTRAVEQPQDPDLTWEQRVNNLQTSLGERRSRRIAESIASHNTANGIPVEQVLYTWARQKGALFAQEILDTTPYNGMSSEENERLLGFVSRTIAEDWITSLGYTAKPRDIDDKIFAAYGLFQ